MDNNLNNLVIILNKFWKTLKPVKLEFFNKNLECLDINTLISLEEEHREIGYKTDIDTNKIVISTISLIATITDILSGQRLAAIIENDFIIGWDIYKNSL